MNDEKKESSTIKRNEIIVFVSHQRASPKGTLVFLEGLVDEHMSLHFVLPVEHRLTQRALVWLFT